MVSIARITEKLVRKKPFIEEAMTRGILNYAALAEDMHEDVEIEFGGKVKQSSIMMALRRLSEKISATKITKIKFDKGTDITIKSDLIELTVRKTDSAQTKLKKLYDEISFEEGDILTITQGLYEVTVITNIKYKDVIKQHLKKEKIIKQFKNLASLSIRIPLSSIETSGLFYMVTRELTWENINIMEIVSTLTELTFIINERELPRAFVVLKRVIEENMKK